MWTFTDFGFFSAVRSKEDPNKLIVRARAREDLEQLILRYGSFLKLTNNDIIVKEGTDYGFRIVVDPQAWGIVLSKSCQEIDYDNFKDAVKNRMGVTRANVYSDVWMALLDIQYPKQKYVLNMPIAMSYSKDNNRTPTKICPEEK